uniref:Oogenesis-related gene n=1 Tax=Astyanax mexicanus TaxID=7994 RepID=A0A3B1JP39_ASTMX
MTSESINIEPERAEGQQQRQVVSKSSGIISSVFCRVSQFWPVSIVVRGVRGLWWLFGFSSRRKVLISDAEAGNSPAARQCRTGRKRLRWASRLLLAILPRRVQGILGYPVCTSIGCTVSPEVRCSPTKPCGKGNKRKQDDMDEDDEPEQQSWVEALNQEMTDEDPAGDPNYEPTTVDTDSEEYRSHNDTESDIEVEKGVVVIKDLEMVRLLSSLTWKLMLFQSHLSNVL